MDPYHRPIDPRLRLRCNRVVNGESTRGGRRQPTFLSQVHDHRLGGAPDLSVFEDHEADIDVSLILFELKWGTVNSLVQQIGAHGGIDCCRQSRACQRTFGTAECGGR